MLAVINALISKAAQRRLVRDGAGVLAVIAVSKPLGLAVNVLLTRLLSIEEMGDYYYILSILTALCTVGLVGMRSGLTRSLAVQLAEGSQGIAVTLVRYSSWIAAATAVIGCLAIWIGGPRLISRSTAVLVGCCLVYASLLGKGYLAGVLRGFGKPLWSTAYVNQLLSYALLIVPLIGLSYVQKGVDLQAVMCLQGGIGVAVAIIGYGIVRSLSRGVVKSRHPPRGWVQALVPFWVTDMVVLIAPEIGIWLLRTHTSAEQIALFGTSQKAVALLAGTLVVSMSNAVSAVMASLHAQGKTAQLKNTVQRTSAMFLLMGLAVLIPFSVWGRSLLRIVYGAQYSRAARVALILLVGRLATLFYGNPYAVLNMTGYGKTATALSTVSAGLYMVVLWQGLRLLPATGVTVAAIYAAYECLEKGIAMLVVRRCVGIWSWSMGSLRSLRPLLNRIRT